MEIWKKGIKRKMNKRNVILIAILILLICLFVIYKNRQPVQRTVTLLEIDSTNVYAFSIKNAMDSIYIEKNSEGKWMVKKPFDFPANQDMVSGFFEHIVKAKRNKKILSEDPGKYDFFQVSPGKGSQVIIYSEDREELANMYFGLSRNITLSSARFENERKVYELTENLIGFLPTIVSMWQDRAITSFKVPEVDRINVQYVGNNYTLVNKGKNFEFQDSEGSFLVYSANRSLFKIVNMINNFNVSSIERDSSGIYAEKLKKPVLKLSFKLKSGAVKEYDLAPLDEGLCVMQENGHTEFYYIIHIDFINRFTKSRENFQDYSEYTY